MTPDGLRTNWTLPLYSRLLYGYEVARTGLYFLEALPLPYIHRLMTGAFPEAPENEKAFLETLRIEILDLLRRDAELIASGQLPLSSLQPRGWRKHGRRLPQVLLDGLRVAYRQGQRKNKEFSSSAREEMEGLPEYYQRNFHFQTDGYFSDFSAEIYEHQVDLLFRGATDAMRRLPLHHLTKDVESSTTPLKILDVACGTGRSSVFYAQTFKKSQVTALDPSASYLSYARKSLSGFKNIDFVKGLGEDLPFKDESFDIVTSTFLFHELPMKVREAVLSEMKRVLKPGGTLVFTDSLQLGDQPQLDWALRQFPQQFHEPFYKNYIENPMDELIEKSGFGHLRKDQGFLAKTILAQKSAP